MSRGAPWALAALLIAAGCGTGTDGKAVAPPTTPAPAPAPAPPPEPPTVRVAAWVVSQPSEPDGYYLGEKIQVVVDFQQRFSTLGNFRTHSNIGSVVDGTGIEPVTSALRTPRSPS